MLVDQVMGEFRQVLAAVSIPDQPFHILRFFDEAGDGLKGQGPFLVAHDDIHLLRLQKLLRLFPKLFCYVFHGL